MQTGVNVCLRADDGTPLPPTWRGEGVWLARSAPWRSRDCGTLCACVWGRLPLNYFFPERIIGASLFDLACLYLTAESWFAFWNICLHNHQSKVYSAPLFASSEMGLCALARIDSSTYSLTLQWPIGWTLMSPHFLMDRWEYILLHLFVGKWTSCIIDCKQKGPLLVVVYIQWPAEVFTPLKLLTHFVMVCTSRCFMWKAYIK